MTSAWKKKGYISNYVPARGAVNTEILRVEAKFTRSLDEF